MSISSAPALRSLVRFHVIRPMANTEQQNMMYTSCHRSNDFSHDSKAS